MEEQGESFEWKQFSEMSTRIRKNDFEYVSIHFDTILNNVKDGMGQNLLHWAALHGRDGDTRIFTFLLNRFDPNEVDIDGNTSLHLAALHGHKDIVKILLCVPNMDATLKNESGKTAEYYASADGWDDIADLIKKREDEIITQRRLNGKEMERKRAENMPIAEKLTLIDGEIDRMERKKEEIAREMNRLNVELNEKRIQKEKYIQEEKERSN
eukprot:TRINITY_DN7715_c0_g1_i2.p1 TRINITY_DN7715_c0_g1~~TRINITY_DN7715_c0_g1_i2.p1  ORF type:complete len:212 (-),score=86.40 TRINITY_DN7715_c0_g1_i2:112-747(-)